ncbi:hypothetical protein JW998_04680 [candidate division KSB1 bacterium]|nr:hypothetical protein [candidate division KSB1 bacterium]
MKKHWSVTAILALSVIAILFSACQKSTESDVQRPSIQDGIRFNREARRQSLAAEAARVDSIRVEAEELMNTLREKEILLQNKEAELDALRRQLSQKETELLLREASAQRAKKTGAWLFAIGVALITLSLILFISKVKRRPKSAAPLSTTDLKADSSVAIAIAEKPEQKPAAKQEAAPAEKKDSIAAPVKTKPTTAGSGRAPRTRTQAGDKAKAAAKKTSRTRIKSAANSGTSPADETPATTPKSRRRKKAAPPDEEKSAPESPQE